MNHPALERHWSIEGGAVASAAQHNAADSHRRLRQARDGTNLVIYLLGRVGQVDGLLEDVAHLGHLLALGPVVKGACHVHLLGGVRPVLHTTRVSILSCATAEGTSERVAGMRAGGETMWGPATYHLNV